MNILRSLKYPLWYLGLNYVTLFLSFFLYAMIFGVEALKQMPLEISLGVGLIVNLIFYLVLIKHYPKEKKPQKDYGTMLLLGFSYSLFWNAFFLQISNSFESEPHIILFFTSVLIGPILEEYVFRGFLFRELKKNYSLMEAMMLSSLLFALFHTTIFQIIFAFFLGLITSYLYHKTGHLRNAILFHMASNFVGFTCQEMLSYASILVWMPLSMIGFLGLLGGKKGTWESALLK